MRGWPPKACHSPCVTTPNLVVLRRRVRIWIDNPKIGQRSGAALPWDGRRGYKPPRQIRTFCVKSCMHKQKGTPKIGECLGPAVSRLGRRWPLQIRSSSTRVTLLNLVVLGQTLRALLSRSVWKIWPPLIAPFKVAQGPRNLRGSIYHRRIPITFHNNHGPISYRFRDKRRFLSKIANSFNPRVFHAPLMGSWQHFVMALVLKNLEWCRFDKYTSVIDGQTDRHRPTETSALTHSVAR